MKHAFVLLAAAVSFACAGEPIRCESSMGKDVSVFPHRTPASICSIYEKCYGDLGKEVPSTFHDDCMTRRYNAFADAAADDCSNLEPCQFFMCMTVHGSASSKAAGILKGTSSHADR